MGESDPNKIRTYRVKRGMSLNELAESVGLRRSEMLDIEEGRSQPSEIELGLIAYALDVQN